MEIINGSPRFQTWDTPTPPSTLDVTRFIYPGCTTFGNANNPRCRFFSIKFEDTVGITFLYHPAKGLVDIQQHRKAGPASYVQPLLDYPADSLVCMYLPTESDTDVCGMSIQVGDTRSTLGCPRLVVSTIFNQKALVRMARFPNKATDRDGGCWHRQYWEKMRPEARAPSDGPPKAIILH